MSENNQRQIEGLIMTYYQQHREYLLAYQREFDQAHRERRRLLARQRYKINGARVREQARAYYWAHKPPATPSPKPTGRPRGTFSDMRQQVANAMRRCPSLSPRDLADALNTDVETVYNKLHELRRNGVIPKRRIV